MTDQLKEVDVVVLGMGPGGEHVANELASVGLSVVGTEGNLVGGECPYWGCVPSKMMIRAANVVAEARRVGVLAGAAEVHPSWAAVANRVRDEATDDWNDRLAVERFEGKGGRVVRGWGRIVGRRAVQVGDMVFSARRGVVIATGSKPLIPSIDGLAGTPYWTNHDAIEAENLPESLLILGGGAIGAELGQMFARFGVDVTMIEGGDRILRNEEPETSEAITSVFEAEGMHIIRGSAASSVDYSTESCLFRVTLASGAVYQGEKLLVAAGRAVDLSSLGVEHIGADPNARSLSVDANMRVAPEVWAVGDVTGSGLFTHIAMYQARIAIADILGESHAGASYHALPRVTFTDPEVGSVGMTEATARRSGLKTAVGLSSVSSSTRGWIHKAGNEGFIKLIADADRGYLVGATSCGPVGGEVLSMLTLAVHERTPVTNLQEMIYAYPTFHRAVEAALKDLDI